MAKLVACSSCSRYVRASESSCPQCGSPIRNERGAVVRTAGAVLMGLSLTACPADDDGDDTMGGSSMTGSTMTGSSTTADPSGTSTDPSSTGIDPTTGPGPEPAYGVGATTDFPTPTTSSGGETDGSSGGTDGSSSGTTGVGEPDYGVPETTGS